nr:T9SS type A sorting domain-containing protein [Bacteroidota bacterium]
MNQHRQKPTRLKPASLAFLILFQFSLNISGQTTLIQHPIDPNHTAVSGITCLDYDQDNDMDIVACHLQINQVILWENDAFAPGGWTKHILNDEMIDPLYITSADVNDDGLPDLIITGNENSLFCLINEDGDNNWQTFVMDDNFNNPHGVCVADVNNDGLKDIIATAAADNTIAWWENNGGTPDEWNKTVISDQMNGSQTVTAADINDDGFTDIIGASSDNNKVKVWYNNGNSPLAFTEQLACQTLLLPHWVSVADINDDGHPDILVAACASGKVAWLESNGENPPEWTTHTIGSNFGCALTVEAADIDMDGDLDVAATAYGTNRLAWWEQQYEGGQIIWIQHVLSYNYKGAWPLVFVDMDNDSDPDMVSGGDLLNGLGNESPLSWWENETMTTSTGSLDRNNKTDISIYPLPASGFLNISYDLKSDAFVRITISNLQGKKLMDVLHTNQEKGFHETGLDFSSKKHSLRPGMYICELNINGQTNTQKLIIK